MRQTSFMLDYLAAARDISHDDDAKHDHHTLLLLLQPSVGVWMSESKQAPSSSTETHPERMSRVVFYV
jgi:hypothetical protein